MEKQPVAAYEFEKKIWMLWLQGRDQAPPLVKACIDSWEKRNPGWGVNVLTQEDVDALWTTEKERIVAKRMPMAALSNMVRTKILLTKGGVWCDATLACMKPLDVWLPPFIKLGFFAFSRPSRDKPLSSWFLAAYPKQYLLGKWLQMTVSVWTQKSVKSIDSVEYLNRLAVRIDQDGKVWQKKKFWESIKNLPYHWYHYSFDYLLKQDKRFANAWDRIPKCSANLPHMVQEDQMLFDDSWTVDAFESWIHDNMAPLFKLNWRKMKPEENEKLQVLLDYCNRD